MTGETVLYTLRQTTTPPSVGIAVVVAYACGHKTHARVAEVGTLPRELKRCPCGGRVCAIYEDAE